MNFGREKKLNHCGLELKNPQCELLFFQYLFFQYRKNNGQAFKGTLASGLLVVRLGLLRAFGQVITVLNAPSCDVPTLKPFKF